MAVLSPIDFPDDKQHPTKGLWNASYELERCNNSKFYNVLFNANSNGETPTEKHQRPAHTALVRPMLTLC